jgi:hypothetical protein
MSVSREDIRMTVIFLALVATLGQNSGPASARGLIDQLATNQHAEAEATLMRLGAKALPSLRRAAAGGDDHTQQRAAALVDRIERALLTEPTLVTLDYRDRPLKEVVDSLAQQSGMRLSLDPINEERWREIRVTVQEPGPVPFWKAIDRLARTARLQYNFAVPQTPGDSVTTLRLVHPGQPPEETPSYSGPFRIHAYKLRYHDDARLVRGADGKIRRAGNPKLDIHVMIKGEPRLRIGQDDLPRRVEIRDDQGRPVTYQPFPGEEKPLDWGFRHVVMVPELSINFWNYELAAPAGAEMRLKSLKATARLAVAASRPDPLVIALDHATGRTFRQGDLAVDVIDVRIGPDGARSIDLAAQRDGGRPFFSLTSPLRSWTYWAGGLIEVHDARGDPMEWTVGPAPPGASATRTTLRILPRDRAAPPAEIRYDGLMRTIVDVPIELNDIPVLER